MVQIAGLVAWLVAVVLLYANVGTVTASLGIAQTDEARLATVILGAGVLAMLVAGIIKYVLPSRWTRVKRM